MNISIIGAGAMGGSTAKGLLKCEDIKPGDITVSDPNDAVLSVFARLGASVTSDNNAAVLTADIVMVVVKPWLVEEVLGGIKESIDYNKQLLIVVAAGVKSSDILRWMRKSDDSEPHLVLCIPNIAIEYRQSMTFLVPVTTSPDATRTVKALFDLLGQVIITEERLLGAATTLASCGIAYAMRYVRAATEGGVELGFKAHDAEEIVVQTVLGACELLQRGSLHPEAAIDLVTTPGGVTIKGLNAMERAGFTNAVISGLKAGSR